MRVKFQNPLSEQCDPLRIKIEGPSGSGKTTLALLLKDFLESRGHQIEATEGGNPIRKRSLHDPDDYQSWTVRIISGDEPFPAKIILRDGIANKSKEVLS